MKKIMFFVLGMWFLSSCENSSSNNSSNSVAVAPESRESFTENFYYKNLPFKDFPAKYKEKELGYIKANEFNTLKEAILSLSSSYNFQQEVLKGDNEKRAIAEQSYITRIRKIQYYKTLPEGISYDCEVDTRGGIDVRTIKYWFAYKNCFIKEYWFKQI